MNSKTIGAIALALGLAACGPQARSTITLVEGDAFLGPADAKVTVTEYGAPTCPACKGWHDQYWAQMKSTYVDSGKIKFIFRELPTHNPAVDAAIFSMARCTDAKEFFAVIDEAFARQADIERASRSADGPKKALISLGQKFRLSEQQVESCIKDPKNLQRIYAVQEEAGGRGVGSTPTFFLNDKEVMDPRFENFSREIDAALGGSAPVAPASTETPAPAAPAPATPAPAAPA